MEVGCLEYPGASTFGSQPLTTEQPSYASRHKRKQKQARDTLKKDINGRKLNKEGRETGWKKLHGKNNAARGKSHVPLNHMKDAANLWVYPYWTSTNNMHWRSSLF